jgi:hypothetical protein
MWKSGLELAFRAQLEAAYLVLPYLSILDAMLEHCFKHARI